MLECAKCEEYISSYLDHELPDEECRLMFAHCSTCESCRMFLSSLLELSLHHGPRTSPTVPASVDARVRSALASVRGTESLSWLASMSRRSIGIPVPVATALLLIGLAAGIRTFWDTPVRTSTVTTTKRQTVTHVMALPVITIDDK